jgi:hypothetical protein
MGSAVDKMSLRVFSDDEAERREHRDEYGRGGRRQFETLPRLIEGLTTPDYATCHYKKSRDT